ncbi:MAG TPA: DUF2400 family protein [Nitrososphaeria archaeon]|nr:DUF2400 family protein [Nitrososphaeria archaeon]
MDEYYRELLDEAYDRFADDLLSTSALSVARGYDREDRDLWALLVALSDYGVDVQGVLIPMLGGLADHLAATGMTLTEVVTSRREVLSSFPWRGRRGVVGWRHRFLRGEVLGALLHSLSSMIEKWGSVTELARSTYDGDAGELIFSLAREIREGALGRLGDPSALSRIAPDPDRPQRSTMKTLTLYLRWMARREYPDLGLWRFVDQSGLYPSLNPGTARTMNRVFDGKDEGRLRVRSLRWEDVEAARELMREINPRDPAKYDYVFSRPSIMGYCAPHFEERVCTYCPLRELCRSSRQVRLGRALRSRVEEAILRRCLETWRDEVADYEVEVPLGRYRADAVVHYRWCEHAVVEVERELNDASVGQVLKYRREYYRLRGEMPRAVIAVEKVNDDGLRRELESELGLKVIVC